VVETMTAGTSCENVKSELISMFRPTPLSGFLRVKVNDG